MGGARLGHQDTLGGHGSGPECENKLNGQESQEDGTRDGVKKNVGGEGHLE